MRTTSDRLEFPVQQMLERGKKTLETVLAKAGASRVESLQTTTNEVTYLMGVARLAIEALGPSPDASERNLYEARLRGLDRISELRRAAEPVLETGQVCALLGVSRETIRKKVDRKQLLALPKGEDRVFPAFQFRDGEILPGLPEVLAALGTDSPFVALSFLLSRDPDWGGKTACDLLRTGGLEAVLAEAQSFLKHGA